MMTGSTTRPLAELLSAQAVQRGLRPVGAPLPGVEEMFTLVRDMPYDRASSHTPEIVIQEWRGTCSTKHELLAALLSEVGVRSTIMACTQEILPPRGADLPAELEAYRAQGPVVDVHNYLLVHAPQGDMLVDATWPVAAKAAGLPVNERFAWGEHMTLACTPLETWAVPEGESVAEFKMRVLRERFTPEQLERRDAFIRAVGQLFSRFRQ